MKTNASNRSKTKRGKAALRAIDSVISPDMNPFHQQILRSKRFLKDEDPELYAQDLQALVDQHQPQTFFDWKNVEDYADKLQDDRRFKAAIPRLIDGKMQSVVRRLVTQEQSDACRIESYLPGLIKLTRLIDNSFQTPKRIEKDLDRPARIRRQDAPSIVPEPSITANETSDWGPR
jgi:hypothetical protein